MFMYKRVNNLDKINSLIICLITFCNNEIKKLVDSSITCRFFFLFSERTGQKKNSG